jgi:hypothetical protein
MVLNISLVPNPSHQAMLVVKVLNLEGYFQHENIATYTNHDSKGHILYPNIYGRVKHGL